MRRPTRCCATAGRSPTGLADGPTWRRSSRRWSAATSTSSSRGCRTRGRADPGARSLRVAEDRQARRASCSAARRDPRHRGLGRGRPYRAASAPFFGLVPVVSGRVRVATIRGRARARRPADRAGRRVSQRGPQERGAGAGPVDRGQRDVLGARAARSARAGCGSNERRAEVARWMARLRVKATRAGTSRSAGSRAATSRRSRWPGCCTRRPTCCCSTSRRRGIDVGSKAEIYRLIGELAAARGRRSWSSARICPSCSVSATAWP